MEAELTSPNLLEVGRLVVPAKREASKRPSSVGLELKLSLFLNALVIDFKVRWKAQRLI